MNCDECISGEVCKHRNFVNLASMSMINRLVRIGMIPEEISKDLIDKTAGTILGQCIKKEKRI